MQAGKKEQLNQLQLMGDPMAVAKQQINAERIKNEVKHLTKNRTDDFVSNPMNRKCFHSYSFQMTNVFLYFYYSRIHNSEAKLHHPIAPLRHQIFRKAQYFGSTRLRSYKS